MKKRIWTIILVCIALAGVLCLTNYCLKQQNKKRIEKIEKNADSWKHNAVTAPKAGSLKAGGFVTISWNSAEVMGNVLGYKVYVDDKMVAETDADTLTYEYHTTTVSAHDVYIEADLSKEAKVYSDITTFYVNKKGLCVNKDMAQNVEAPDWGVSWYYNWSMEAFKYTSFQDLEYVPMMWKSQDSDQKTISRFSKWGYKYVLAFNEPDLSEQSCIDVDTAVEGMKAFMNQNLLVGAPATALCPPWSKNWFQPFMEKMKYYGMDVDFIPIHHYWNWWTDEGADAFIKLVKDTYEMYHKPIWITEFAISGDPGQNDEQIQSVIGYMKRVIKQLDQLDFVERYAWFSFNPHDKRNGGSALMRYYEGTITKLGYLYQELGMPKGYGDKDAVCIKTNEKKDIIR